MTNITPEVINEFEELCKSIDRPPVGCEFNYKEQKYNPVTEILPQDFNGAYSSSRHLNFGLEVWLKQREKIDSMIELLQKIEKDLLMRSSKDSDGYSVVDLSNSIWIELKEALEATNGG